MQLLDKNPETQPLVSLNISDIQLGWLIDPQNQRVEIYRLERETEILQSPTQLSGEDILPGFTLDLTTIW